MRRRPADLVSLRSDLVVSPCRRALAWSLALSCLAAAPQQSAAQDGAQAGASYTTATAREIVRLAEAGLEVGTAPTYQLPIDAGRLLYRFGKDLPAPVEAFLAAHNRGAEVYWDHRNGTLRTCLPFAPLPLVAPTQEQGAQPAGVSLSDTTGLTLAVEAFLDRHAELIGADSTRLDTPYVYPLLEHRVLVFPLTTPGGLPVRGGHVRVVVLGDGRVGMVKAFVARGVEDPAGPFLERSMVEEIARAEDWGLVHSARLELAFLEGTLESAAPVWSLQVREPDGGSAELLVDARTGERRGRVVVVKHFDGQGAAAGQRIEGKIRTSGPRIRDKFQSPWLNMERLPDESLLEGVLVGEIVNTGDGLEHVLKVTHSLETGDYGFPSGSQEATARPFASLRWGHLDWCAPVCNIVPVAEVRIFPKILTGEGMPVGMPRTTLPANMVDLEGDQVVEVVETVTVDAPRTDLHFNGGRSKDFVSERANAHWLQTFEAGRSVTAFATTVLHRFFGLAPEEFRHPPFLPLSPLCLLPWPLHDDLSDAEHTVLHMVVNALQIYTPPGDECTLRVGKDIVRLAAVQTGLVFSANPRDPAALPRAGVQPIHLNGFEHDRLVKENKPPTKVVEQVLPTIIQHEVGHHIFFHLTQVHSHNDPWTNAVEEGVADVLTAWTNDDERIGFQLDGDGNAVPSAAGFTVDRRRPNDFRSPLRIDVAQGFWELSRIMVDWNAPEFPLDRKVARFLLFSWLMLHRVESPETGQSLDRSRDIVSMLKFIDDSVLEHPRADGNLANGSPHGALIQHAFQNGDHFQEAPFLRGDTNLDQNLDISDVISALTYLFGGEGEAHDCRNAVDVNNDGAINVTDPIWLLGFLFQGGPPPAAPWNFCDFDREAPGAAGNLGCREFTCPR